MSQSASRRKKPQYGPPQGIQLRRRTRPEIREVALKMQKAKLVEMGLIAPDEPRKPDKWAWENPEAVSGQPANGTVYGFTRSDARGEIKKLLGISKKKRLPISIKITKVQEDE